MKERSKKAIKLFVSIIVIIIIIIMSVYLYFDVLNVPLRLEEQQRIINFENSLNVTDFYVTVMPNTTSPYWINITSGSKIQSSYRYIQIENGPYNALIHDAWLIVYVNSLDNSTSLKIWILDKSKQIAYSGACRNYHFSNYTWKG
jgi:hypothetical protein